MSEFVLDRTDPSEGFLRGLAVCALALGVACLLVMV